MKETKLSFILGGARSGKSSYAENFAREKAEKVLFIATATAEDEEMRQRIQNHQNSRPTNWQTLEASLNISGALEEYLREHEFPEIIILDCITLLTSNILCSFPPGDSGLKEFEKETSAQISALLKMIKKIPAHWLVISNEIGLGIVPANAYSRSYRDALGRANQQIAAEADEVLLMVAGIPMQVKP